MEFLPELFDAERWTCFCCVFVVAVDMLLADVTRLHERRDELVKCCRLEWCASVFRLAVLVYATDVAYTDAVLVVTLAVCSSLSNGPTCLDSAVEGDDIMIADVTPAFLQMPLSYRVCMYVTALWCGGAMEYDVCYFSHCFLFLRFWFMRSVTLLMVVPKPRRVAAKMSSWAMR